MFEAEVGDDVYEEDPTVIGNKEKGILLAARKIFDVIGSN